MEKFINCLVVIIQLLTIPLVSAVNEDVVTFENEYFKIYRYASSIDICCKTNKSWVSHLKKTLDGLDAYTANYIWYYQPNEDLGHLLFNKVSLNDCTFFDDVNIFNDILIPLKSENCSSLMLKETRSALHQENLRHLNLKNLEFSHGLFQVKYDIFNDCHFETLLIESVEFNNVPDNFFKHLSNLEKLIIHNTTLKRLKRDDLTQLTILKSLIVSRNEVTEIESGAFDTLSNLNQLEITSNNLVTLPSNVFKNLQKLQTLNLEDNKFNNLPDDLFDRNSKLKVFKLSNNRGKLKTLPSKFFKNQINLEDIDLQNNKFSSVPEDVFSDAHSLLRLNFTGKLEKIVYDTIKIDANNLTCAEPPELKYRQVTSLSSEEIKCSMNCSNICHCIDYPGKLHLVIDCSNKHLTSVPDVFSEFLQQYQLKNYSLEFNLSRNKFEKTPSMKKFDSMKVISIDLSNNFITDVTLDIFTTTLKKLHLNDNKISELDFKIVKYFKKNILYLPSLYLHNNEWRCICDNFNFVTLVRSYPMIFGLSNKLTCHDTGVEFSTIGPSDLCKNSQLIIIIISLSIAGFLGIVGCLAAVFYKYEMKIKIWLYSKQWCLRFITEEELDKDKKYDAFISYSHEDRDFVHEEIVKTLEQSAESFKLCLHDRDWLAGEWIPHQIEDSIQNSKRTIIVLSQNYLKSCWSKMEFFIAYKQTVKERRTHLIIILLEDIGDTKILTPEIKSYLSVNTYLKSDDPKFYEKLKLALPPRHNLSNCRRKSKKSRVMALRKFDLYQDEHRKELKNEIPLKNISIASERFLIEAESEVGVTFTTENTAV